MKIRAHNTGLGDDAPVAADGTQSVTVSAGGERRHLTLFCDLVGSVTLTSQLDPEEWRATVAGYQRAASDAVSRFGGHRSLKQKALEFRDIVTKHGGPDVDADTPFDSGFAKWEEIERLFDAVNNGNKEWGVPKYNGGLFSNDPDVSTLGAELAEVRLNNKNLASILSKLLLDQTPEDEVRLIFAASASASSRPSTKVCSRTNLNRGGRPDGRSYMNAEK